MCASFILKANARKLALKFGLTLRDPHLPDEWEFQPLGYMKTHVAPVIIGTSKGEKEVRLMRFSLCPSWSKEFPFKASSYNARMERPLEKKDGKTGEKKRVLDPKTKQPLSEYIYQIPSWRGSFNSGKTCLVPISWAIESCHFGRSKGKVIQVAQQNEEPYLAVGIWSDWTDPATGETQETFALLTDDPYRYFFEQGHDRSLFIIPDSHHEKWLFEKEMKPEKRFQFLRDNRITLDWKAIVVRDLKKTQKFSDEDINSIKVWDG